MTFSEIARSFIQKPLADVCKINGNRWDSSQVQRVETAALKVLEDSFYRLQEFIRDLRHITLEDPGSQQLLSLFHTALEKDPTYFDAKSSVQKLLEEKEDHIRREIKSYVNAGNTEAVISLVKREGVMAALAVAEVFRGSSPSRGLISRLFSRSKSEFSEIEVLKHILDENPMWIKNWIQNCPWLMNLLAQSDAHDVFQKYFCFFSSNRIGYDVIQSAANVMRCSSERSDAFICHFVSILEQNPLAVNRFKYADIQFILSQIAAEQLQNASWNTFAQRLQEKESSLKTEISGYIEAGDTEVVISLVQREGALAASAAAAVFPDSASMATRSPPKFDAIKFLGYILSDNSSWASDWVQGNSRIMDFLIQSNEPDLFQQCFLRFRWDDMSDKMIQDAASVMRCSPRRSDRFISDFVDMFAQFPRKLELLSQEDLEFILKQPPEIRGDKWPRLRGYLLRDIEECMNEYRRQANELYEPGPVFPWLWSLLPIQQFIQAVKASSASTDFQRLVVSFLENPSKFDELVGRPKKQDTWESEEFDPRIFCLLTRPAEAEEEKVSLEAIDQAREQLEAALRAAGDPFIIDDIGSNTYWNVSCLLKQVDTELEACRQQNSSRTISATEFSETQRSLMARQEALQDLSTKLVNYLYASGKGRWAGYDRVGANGEQECIIS